MFSLPLVFWTWQGSVFRRIFSSGGTQWIPHSLTICVFQFWEISLNYFHSWHLQRVLFVLSVLLSAMDHPVFSFPAFHHLVIDSIFWMVSSALCYNFAEWFLQLYVTISCGTFHPSFQMCSFQELSILWRFKAPLLSCPSCINAKAMLSFCRIREQLRQPRLCSSPHQPSQDPCLFLPVTCSVWRPMAIYPHF